MSNEGLYLKGMNKRILFCSLTLLIIFLVGLILPKSVKAESAVSTTNSFYTTIINNTLSIIKCSVKDEQPTNSGTSMSFAALSFLGIDIVNPISIVAKEISYLDKTEGTSDVNVNNISNQVEKVKSFILNPFNLADNQVSKAESPNVIANLYNPALKQTLNNAKPRVLIYHTHTTEAYLTSDKDTYINSSSDLSRTVCAVGDVIKSELEKIYGISVIHDETLHNLVDYDASYKKSGATLDKYLRSYGNFDLIIDLHRDGFNITNKQVPKIKLNGEDVAQIMFVVAQANPRYAKQKKLVNSMIGISNKLYPNLLKDKEITVVNRGIDFYNQNKSDNALLVEVGSNNNTIAQVKNTGMYLSRIIAEQLNGKK